MEDELTEKIKSIIKETNVEKTERELKALLFKKVSLIALDNFDNQV